MPKSKLTRSHTTTNGSASLIVSKLDGLDDVSKISLGIITPCTVLRGNKRVAIHKETGCYLLKIRDTSSVQEVRVYSSVDKFAESLSKLLKELEFEVTLK